MMDQGVAWRFGSFYKALMAYPFLLISPPSAEEVHSESSDHTRVTLHRAWHLSRIAGVPGAALHQPTEAEDERGD